MNIQNIAQAELVYSAMAANYSNIIGNRPFLSGELAIITKDNQYLFILENLIQLGFVRKLESGMYQLKIDLADRIDNLNYTRKQFELTIEEAKSEIENIERIKEIIMKNNDTGN